MHETSSIVLGYACLLGALAAGERYRPCDDIEDEDGVVASERAAGLGHDGRHGNAALEAHIAQGAHHVVRIVLRREADRGRENEEVPFQKGARVQRMDACLDA
jgi:hypothetical protein